MLSQPSRAVLFNCLSFVGESLCSRSDRGQRAGEGSRIPDFAVVVRDVHPRRLARRFKQDLDERLVLRSRCTQEVSCVASDGSPASCAATVR